MSVAVKNVPAVTRKLYVIRKNVGEVSPALQKVMQASAVLLESQTKLNIRKNKMSSSGALMSSVRGESTVQGKSIFVRVYSDLIYSRIHEEGKDTFSRKMQKAMFWRLRQEGRWREGYTSKKVAPGGSGGFRGRPYMQPAYDMYKKKIYEMVRKAIIGEK